MKNNACISCDQWSKHCLRSDGISVCLFVGFFSPSGGGEI